ncbi:MAG: hypothetical protein HKO76_00275 [Acidimicrobiia bacterium]|nr:hypothetical protein [Acidimicrobiia bacterium]
MRGVLLFSVLVLTACGGNGDSVQTTPQITQHIPEISNLTLSPDSALYMEGDGSIQVTVELSYADVGRDIDSLHIRMTGDTNLVMPVSESANSASGTLTEIISVTTEVAGEYEVEIWLVDEAEQSSNHLFRSFSVISHTPEILDVDLSPVGATYMEGGGRVVVSAEITFRDVGGDLERLWIGFPDGTIIEYAELVETETGTFTKDFTMSTETVGAFAVELWLKDSTGEYSAHRTAEFVVAADAQESEWTRRLSGLPGPLYDVIWDGQVFIAVGYGGAIWTSVNGTDWVARDSGTDADLWAVSSDGRNIFAVGGFVVLLSTDHGATWSVNARPNYIALTAVAVNESQVVAIGGVPDLFFPKIMISEDSGDTWTTSDFYAWATDLVYRDGLFVATTMSHVLVSTDGKVWNEALLHEWSKFGWMRVAIHDGSQFIVAGDRGTVYLSFDAFNWTEVATPFDDVDYWSAAWNGSVMILAGGVSDYHTSGAVHRPNGISSTDGGATWDSFVIDTNYRSYGIAWGNGRFVSVGWTVASDGGAIYTTN